MTTETQPLPTDAERALFEAEWLKVTGETASTWDAVCASAGEPVPAHVAGRYFVRATHAAWLIWQAARRTPAPVGVRPVATLIVDRFATQVKALPASHDVRPYGAHDLYTAVASRGQTPAGAVECIREAIAAYRLTHWADEDGGLGLADALSQLYGDNDIGRASEELDGLTDEIAASIAAPVGVEPATLITIESSLRFRLANAKEDVEQLVIENRELRERVAKLKNAPPVLAMGRVPLTDQQIDQAIAELGLNYLADAHATNRAVLRKLCRHAHGIKQGGQHG